jgi:hypothetical protein
VTDLAVIINPAGTRFTLLEDQMFPEEYVVVPAGYRCDFASIPKLFWSFGFTPLGRHQQAALMHDFLYDQHHDAIRALNQGSMGAMLTEKILITRASADAAFLRQMKRDGVGWRSRWTMYLMVRMFGGFYWNNHEAKGSHGP